MAGRDIVVLGASAGGVEALARLVSHLPEDLPATLFVVLHVATHSVLPKILSKSGPLPAVHAAHLEMFYPGHIYVAPPDRHLLIADGYVRVVIGPKENNARPAADVLFRSAARQYGRRAVGVVLSGALHDGTVGLDAISRAGGVTVAQDPDEAFCPDMPLNAITSVHVDHVLSTVRIARLIDELAREPLPEIVMTQAQTPTEAEADRDRSTDDARTEGKPSAFSCPDCGGVLWELDEGEPVRYRCRVGHAYVDEGLAMQQHALVESALWTALRALEEQAHVLKRLAQRAHDREQVRVAAQYHERAQDAERQANLLREALTVHVEKTAPAELEEALPAPESEPEPEQDEEQGQDQEK